jgi:hypothetical protein
VSAERPHGLCSSYDETELPMGRIVLDLDVPSETGARTRVRAAPGPGS